MATRQRSARVSLAPLATNGALADGGRREYAGAGIPPDLLPPPQADYVGRDLRSHWRLAALARYSSREPSSEASAPQRRATVCYNGSVTERLPIPRHRRVETPPRMSMNQRDLRVLQAVHGCRVLRRDQIQRLLFPSKNTANELLKRLYQNGFLQRRWLQVEYGKGMGQALYLLDRRGAEAVASNRGTDVPRLHWSPSHNRVSFPFLEHTLMINDVRIAVSLAAKRLSRPLERWIPEEELTAHPDYVTLPMFRGTRKVAVIPDGYFSLHLGDRRASFFLEADRATVSNKRWAVRVRACMEYVRSGRYSQRFDARSLRVLTVTTGEKRLANVKRTTEKARGDATFSFAPLERVEPKTVLSRPIWQAAGQDGLHTLIG